MLFYEPLFLFLFAPAVYLLYLFFGVDRRQRAIVLLLASIAFYGWIEPSFIFIIFISIALDLLVVGRIAASHASAAPSASREHSDPDFRAAGGRVAIFYPRSRARLWLGLGVASNLALLVYYKYAGFLALDLDALLCAITLPGIRIPEIALPVGVSFIVFEKITYLVDVYRGVTARARGPLLYALYVFFFPKLLAGPIVKYHDIVGQFETCPHADADDFISGFSRFMLGVMKKLLLADVMASGADIIFSRDPSTLAFADAWAGAVFYTLQIYFDFSGYSDMAIGLARIFGFRLLENFDMPYIATSVTDFWRRWHMSLTSWIREYLYFPLGGNRKGERRTYLNLWICFLASGLWHGAAWTYVFWGAYNGAFLIFDRLFLLERFKRLPVWLANATTMLIVTVGWVIFRAPTLDQAGALLSVMAQPSAQASAPVTLTPDYFIVAVIGISICVVQRIGASLEVDWMALARRNAFAVNAALAILFVAALAKGLAGPFKPFIYFRF